MPTDHRVRLDHDQGVSPARPEPEQRNPEGSIDRRELGMSFLLSVRSELLAQSQLDDHLLTVASEDGKGTAKECQSEIEERLHRRETLQNLSAQRQTDSPPDPVVALVVGA